MELIGLLTAILGLLAAIITLRALTTKRKDDVARITPPEDQETRALIERTIWERKAPRRPAIYESGRPPILVVANMKGGVGKTTITANLGAFLSSAPQNKKVLLIDFDYQ